MTTFDENLSFLHQYQLRQWCNPDVTRLTTDVNLQVWRNWASRAKQALTNCDDPQRVLALYEEGKQFLHEETSYHAFEHLRSRILVHCPVEQRALLSTIPVAAIPTRTIQAQTIWSEDKKNRAIGIDGGMMAWLSLLNVATVSLYHRFSLKGDTQDPALRCHIHELFRAWYDGFSAGFPEQPNIPEKQHLAATAETLTCSQIVFLMCHEYGHILAEESTGPTQLLSERKDELDSLLGQNKMGDQVGEMVADQLGFELYRCFVDGEFRAEDSARSLAQIAPDIFFSYVDYFDSIEYREAFDARSSPDDFREKIFRRAIEEFDHPLGMSRRGLYRLHTAGWYSENSEGIATAYEWMLKEILDDYA